MRGVCLATCGATFRRHSRYDPGMSEMNSALQAARRALRLSQDEFAAALRKAGAADSVSKRTVQRYEAGQVRSPQPRQARALEKVTGLPIVLLGFEPPAIGALVADDGRGGHDVHHPAPELAAMASRPAAGRGGYSGVWLSRYEYYSSGRTESYAGLHYVILLQHGDRLTVRSLPGSAKSSMTMDMSVDGSVLTGTWVEDTDPTGYYRGARYHGAIQMLAEPTGRRIVGKWVGFGKAMDVNTGPWELVFEDASMSKATLERYNSRPPTE